MTVYLIGDVQGCDDALQRLLSTVAFSPSRDVLYLLGDLVNRGPSSLQVLRRVTALGDAARCILGNHDLHLLAVAQGVRTAHRSDSLDDVLQASDQAALLEWLRAQPLARYERGCLMVHAGVLPQWDATKVIAASDYFMRAMGQNDYKNFLTQMCGNQPAAWQDDLQGHDRLRVIVNALTRLRFCSAQGVMEFNTKEGADAAPVGYLPWFEVPGRLTQHTPVAFGHWSTLGLLQRPKLLGLDTGCVWGGCLSAYRLPDDFEQQPDFLRGEVIQVKCIAAQQPGISN
jgi:bis(5'-nucleosyl)-tetraphosphatase (symmetrical)